MAHGGNTIWCGSRVQVTTTYGAVLQGTQGINRGPREDGETLVELDDGREVHLPIKLLARIDKTLSDDDVSSWYPYNPEDDEGRNRILEREKRDGYLYELRGRTGRWFVTRWFTAGLAMDTQIFRTKFFQCQRLAYEALNHFTQ